MFSTPDYFINAEVAYRRERTSDYFKGRRRRRHNVRRRRNPYERPRDHQTVAGGTVVVA